MGPGGGEGNRSLSYAELAPRLVDHVQRAGFTHVELLPPMEHPFYGSWGYQITGYFAPTSRYGTPQDFKAFIDMLHGRGIGVILDWVPSHFPDDPHGLARFDGGPLYEYADPRLAIQPEWNSLMFDYARGEVRSFLISSALHWLSEYHADGLRVDAVTSMLYRDYFRGAGEWVPNAEGGRENLEAIEFLRDLNDAVSAVQPEVVMIAEESTNRPGVTRPRREGGLGFGLRWDMGWSHDTLDLLQRDPAERPAHLGRLAVRQGYLPGERSVLALSHDVGSLLGRMPGDDPERRATLRLLLGLMYAQPGKKLLFMGGEFGHPTAWNHDDALAWECLDEPRHAGILRWVGELNGLYRDEPALHERDGGEWLEWIGTSREGVVGFLRRAEGGRVVLVAANVTREMRSGFTVSVPLEGRWRVAANSDREVYGGAGAHVADELVTVSAPADGRDPSLMLELPPLAILFLRPEAP